MVVEFSPRCDGCHAVFRVSNNNDGDGDGVVVEPVSVGCAHTLCRDCAEGNKGAYGALQSDDESDDDNEEGEGERKGVVDERVKAKARGRCGVCGGGSGGAAAVQEAVVAALRKGANHDNDHDGDGGQQAAVCDVCGEDGSGSHPATHFCEECNEHMCHDMAKAHQRMKATAKHALRALQGAHATPQRLCPVHNQPFGKYYCKDDHCFLCIDCLAKAHHNHGVLELGDELVAVLRGWLGQEVGKAEARASELERAEAGAVEDRDEAMTSARHTIASINAVFDEFEKKRKELIREVRKARKQSYQRLNDVRTTSRVLRQGVDAVQRALDTLANAPSHSTVFQAELLGQQLQRLVEGSKGMCAGQGRTPLAFNHNANALKTWCDSLEVRPSGAGAKKADGERRASPQPGDRVHFLHPVDKLEYGGAVHALLAGGAFLIVPDGDVDSVAVPPRCILGVLGSSPTPHHGPSPSPTPHHGPSPSPTPHHGPSRVNHDHYHHEPPVPAQGGDAAAGMHFVPLNAHHDPNAASEGDNAARTDRPPRPGDVVCCRDSEQGVFHARVLRVADKTTFPLFVLKGAVNVVVFAEQYVGIVEQAPQTAPQPAAGPHLHQYPGIPQPPRDPPPFRGEGSSEAFARGRRTSAPLIPGGCNAQVGDTVRFRDPRSATELSGSVVGVGQGGSFPLEVRCGENTWRVYGAHFLGVESPQRGPHRAGGEHGGRGQEWW